MREQQQFIAMLDRACIGYGTRSDYLDGQVVGESVLVETNHEDGFWVTEFGFNIDGKLEEVVSYEGEEG